MQTSTSLDVSVYQAPPRSPYPYKAVSDRDRKIRRPAARAAPAASPSSASNLPPPGTTA